MEPQFQDILRQGLSLVQTLAPIAAAIGGPAVAGVANIATALAETGEAYLARKGDDDFVFSTDDEKAIKALIDQIHAENTALAAQIASS